MAVSKQTAQKFDGERFNIRNVRKQYQIEITNRFVALENLDVYKDVNRSWEIIKENIKTSAKESLGLHDWKQHKPWFDEECLDFSDQRKHAKMRWLSIQTKTMYII